MHVEQQRPDLQIILVGISLFLKPTMAACDARINRAIQLKDGLFINASRQAQSPRTTANGTTKTALRDVNGFMVQDASKGPGPFAHHGMTNSQFTTARIPLARGTGKIRLCDHHSDSVAIQRTQKSRDRFSIV